VRKDRTLIAPLTIPAPHDQGSVSSTSELFAHNDDSETPGPMRTASQLSHRKPAPPEVPADVDPASGSPMPQVYSDTESPLEPPPALRPRNGSVASPGFPSPHMLMPGSPAPSEIVYSASAVTARVNRQHFTAETPTTVDL